MPKRAHLYDDNGNEMAMGLSVPDADKWPAFIDFQMVAWTAGEARELKPAVIRVGSFARKGADDKDAHYHPMKDK